MLLCNDDAILYCCLRSTIEARVEAPSKHNMLRCDDANRACCPQSAMSDYSALVRVHKGGASFSDRRKPQNNYFDIKKDKPLTCIIIPTPPSSCSTACRLTSYPLQLIISQQYSMSVAFYHPLLQNDLLLCRSGALKRRNTAASNISPNFDFEQQPTAYSVSADLPGLGEEDVKLEQLYQGILSIAAEKEEEVQKEGEDGKPVTVRRTTRVFRHSFKLPEDVDEQGISAEMDEGVLTLKLLKRPEVAPRRITVDDGRASGLEACNP